MSEKFKYDVFLSFSSKDAPFAREAWQKMQDAGLSVFWSDESLHNNVGQSFIDALQNALKQSRHFLLICTPHAFRSGWVKTEYQTFYNEYFLPSQEKRRLILLPGKDFKHTHVPNYLKRIQVALNIKQVIDAFTHDAQFKIYADRNKKKEHHISLEIKEPEEETNDQHPQLIRQERPRENEIHNPIRTELNPPIKPLWRPKKWMLQLAGGLVLLVIAFFLLRGVFIGQPKNKVIIDSTEIFLWRDMKIEKSIWAMNQYLTQYPKGQFKYEAVMMKDSLMDVEKIRKEESFWKMANKINTIEFYLDYVEKYPKGKYCVKALTRISSLEKEKPDDNVEIIVYKPGSPKEKLLKFLENIGSDMTNSAYEFADPQKWPTLEKFKQSELVTLLKDVEMNVAATLYNDGNESCIFTDFLFFDRTEGKKYGIKQKFYLKVYDNKWKISDYQTIEVYTPK